MTNDFKRILYSVRSSYLTLEKSECNLKIRTLRGTGLNDALIIPLSSDDEICLFPYELKVKRNAGDINICFLGSDSMFMKGSGEGLVLEFPKTDKNEYIADFVYEKDGIIFSCDYHNRVYQCIIPIKGTLKTNALRPIGSVKYEYRKIEIIPDSNGEYEIYYEQFTSQSVVPTYSDYSYDRAVAETKNDFEEWTRKFGSMCDEDEEAVYCLWANIVAKGGHFANDSIMMSKSGMTNVWTWDNAINALAMADRDFDLALNQFMIPYEHMDSYGCIPDAVNYITVSTGYTKPPIHGWIYKLMIKKNKRFEEPKILKKVYEGVKKNTDWWLNFRGETPFYIHGNDSGADNSTCFDRYQQLESPDLPAFLSIQCEFLCESAKKLGIEEDVERYKLLSEMLLKTATDNYWDGEKIFVRDALTKEKYYCDGLLPLRMLVLGKKLPKDILEYLVKRISNDFLGATGVASEAIKSDKFDENGYWRGSVWAPEQVIICKALEELGYKELDEKIRSRYISTLKKTGFFENHSAIRDAGERSRGQSYKMYSWTASAYFILK